MKHLEKTLLIEELEFIVKDKKTQWIEFKDYGLKNFLKLNSSQLIFLIYLIKKDLLSKGLEINIISDESEFIDISEN